GKRYVSAQDLADDLGRFLAGEPIHARPVSAVTRGVKWAQRNRAVASLLGTIAGLLLAVTVGSLLAAGAFGQERGQAEEARRKADEERRKAVEAERKARLREAEALVGEAHGIRYSRRPGQRFAALAALKKAAAIGRELGQPPEWFDRLRNEAIAALALPDV